VIVRIAESGERLEMVRIVNDPERLAAVMARAGEAPEACGCRELGHVMRQILVKERPPRRSRRSGRTVAPQGLGVRPAGGC